MAETRSLTASKGPLRGTIAVPGDKSISHRALMFASLAQGRSQVRGLLESGDVMATASALRALGTEIERDGEAWSVTPAAGGWREPDGVIDCGNSGTSMRLLCGMLASQPLFAVLTGDASLRRRPMNRVCKPLRSMGAHIDGRDHGDRAPLAIRGGSLEAAHHDLPLASAQVKSALLLAGLRCGVAVREPKRSRDHTERMLRQMGVTLRDDPEGWLLLMPPERLEPLDVRVPGDASSAAFLMAAAAIVPGSEVRIAGVGLNPTRTGFLDILVAMGADVEVLPAAATGGEPMGDVVVRGSDLVGTRIDGELTVRALDEMPITAVLAACASGTTTIDDAAELRVKESDRIHRTVQGLKALGVEVEERPSGMVIRGGRFQRPAEIDAEGDHRIAMAFAVAALRAESDVTLRGAEEVSTSYPSFFEDLCRLQAPD